MVDSQSPFTTPTRGRYGKGTEPNELDYWSMSPGGGGDALTWSSNPQSPTVERATLISSEEIVSRPRSRTVPFSILFLLLFVGLSSICFCRITVNQAASKAAKLTESRNKMRTALVLAEKEVSGLQREVSAMDMMLNKEKEVENQSSQAEAEADVTRQRAMAELNNLQYHVQNNSKQADALKKQVQDQSKKRILQKYGDSAHRVEIELVFPDGKEGPTTFIVALAPIEFMPHSVETFLDMVSAGLLDGCSFILNALHVLKAAPLPYDGSSASAKVKAFTDHGLESVAFREYSQFYTHRKYTIGFAADGSPSFYINTEDNSLIHAGDPCFGKVVHGIDTIRRLEASPTRSGIWFKKRIGIKRARILPE